MLFGAVTFLLVGCAFGDEYKKAALDSNAAVQACRARRESGELKTQTESVECSNPAVLAAFSNAEYPYMDLVRALLAERLAIADEVDRGKVSDAEGKAKLAEAQVRFNDEVRQRVNGENAAASAITPVQTHCVNTGYGNTSCVSY
jgi:hypothetical protein